MIKTLNALILLSGISLLFVATIAVFVGGELTALLCYPIGFNFIYTYIRNFKIMKR